VLGCVRTACQSSKQVKLCGCFLRSNFIGCANTFAIRYLKIKKAFAVFAIILICSHNVVTFNQNNISFSFCIFKWVQLIIVLIFYLIINCICVWRSSIQEIDPNLASLKNWTRNGNGNIQLFMHNNPMLFYNSLLIERCMRANYYSKTQWLLVTWKAAGLLCVKSGIIINSSGDKLFYHDSLLFVL
jgi:hypothetical protein